MTAAAAAASCLENSGHSSRARVPALDGVRGLAILGVLVVHCREVLDAGGGPVRRFILGHVLEAGVYGVDLFFVLSGFLITGVLLDARGSPGYFKDFYARRFLRLFPVYYLFLLVVGVAAPAFHRAIGASIPDYDGNWWWYLGYLSNWKGGHGLDDPHLNHFWSLAIEEQFYLAWPVAVLLLPRRRLAALCVALTVAAIGLRTALDQIGWLNASYRITPARMDQLALGALAAIALRDLRWRAVCERHARRTWAGGVALFCAFSAIAVGLGWPHPMYRVPGTALMGVAFSALVIEAATARRGWVARVGSWPVLRACGKYSYTMYVVHLFVYGHLTWGLAWLERRIELLRMLPFRVAAALAMMGAVFLTAKLSWKYLESPIFEWRDRGAATRRHSARWLMSRTVRERQ